MTTPTKQTPPPPNKLIETITEYNPNVTQVFIFKPLTFSVLTLYWIYRTQHDQSLLGIYVLLGLIFSGIGGVLLLFYFYVPNPLEIYFLASIVAFAATHVFFILAYIWTIQHGSYAPSSIAERLLLTFPCIMIAVCMLAYLWAGLGDEKIPVVFYCIMEGSMVGIAAQRLWSTNRMSFWMVLLGAVIMMMSDFGIGMQMFAGWKSRWMDPYILGTYWVSQYLIVKGLLEHMRMDSHWQRWGKVKSQ